MKDKTMEKQYLIEIIEQTIDMVNSIKKPENKTKAIVNAADRIISNSKPLPEQPVSPLPTVEKKETIKQIVEILQSPILRRVKCDRCSGEGRINFIGYRQSDECPRCDGRGKIYATNYNKTAQAISALYEPKQDEAKERYEKAIKEMDGSYFYYKLRAAWSDKEVRDALTKALQIASGYTPPESNLTDKT